jgi:hypothetical protein
MHPRMAKKWDRMSRWSWLSYLNGVGRRRQTRQTQFHFCQIAGVHFEWLSSIQLTYTCYLVSSEQWLDQNLPP